MRVLKRRRRENKTDYTRRLKLLKSDKPRIVIRKTNKYIIVQYVTSDEARDTVIFGLDSKRLLEYGWPKEAQGSLKSVPACYLTGFLFGKKVLDMLSEEKTASIIDIGMIRNIPKSRVFAAVKGIIDSGVKLNQKETSFPSEDRIKGKHMKKDIDAIFQKIIKKIEGETK